MNLRVIGAGLPRTGTSSLRVALEHLLGGRCYHMSAIPGHPFDLGARWDAALDGSKPDWDTMFDGFLATVDWPASFFGASLVRPIPMRWSCSRCAKTPRRGGRVRTRRSCPWRATALTPGWKQGRGLVTILERFTGTGEWDDPATLMAAYDRHNEQVRERVAPARLLEWHPSQGWPPICRALRLPVPKILFPWVNRRSEWG